MSSKQQSHQENLSFKMAGIRALHTHMQRRWCIRGVRHFSKVGETLVIFWTNELQKRQPAHDLVLTNIGGEFNGCVYLL